MEEEVRPLGGDMDRSMAMELRILDGSFSESLDLRYGDGESSESLMSLSRKSPPPTPSHTDRKSVV